MLFLQQHLLTLSEKGVFILLSHRNVTNKQTNKQTMMAVLPRVRKAKGSLEGSGGWNPRTFWVRVGDVCNVKTSSKATLLSDERQNRSFGVGTQGTCLAEPWYVSSRSQLLAIPLPWETWTQGYEMTSLYSSPKRTWFTINPIQYFLDVL